MTSKSPQASMTEPSHLIDRNNYTGSTIIRHHLQHPPTTYYPQGRYPAPRAPPRLYVPSSRQHSSVSSDGTASSTLSTSKINRPHYTSPYYLSPMAEQGHISPSRSDRKTRTGTSETPQSMSDTGRRTRDDNSTVFRYIQEQEEHEREDDHALSVLAFLSALEPLYSTFTAFYSILIGLIFLLASPFHICNKSFAPDDNIVRLLAPLLRKHLQLIHADSVEDLHNFDFNPFMLVLVNAISPILSIGVAVAAWIAACFWLFALVMGNPDGTERGDDGRATVLNLRNWWEKFLLSSAKRR